MKTCICLRCDQHFCYRWQTKDDGTKSLISDPCNHHHGKFRWDKTQVSEKNKKKKTWTCCGQRYYRSPPCTTVKHHVTDLNTKFDDSSQRYVATGQTTIRTRDIVALDCEMLFTVDGLQLGRVTVLNSRGKKLFDECVLYPEEDIIDYCTQYSGLTDADILFATYTFEEVRDYVLSIISEDTIVVGHSVENDLKVLKIAHSKVVDTSVLYPNDNPRHKTALRTLTEKHLGRTIQAAANGHDSTEDALAALDLAILHINNTLPW